MHVHDVALLLAASSLVALSTGCSVEPPGGPGFTTGPLETTGDGDGETTGDGDGDTGDGDGDGDGDTGDGDGDGDGDTGDGDGDTDCGNGNLDPGEECDDGNTLDSDDCTSQCLMAVCGDGIIHTGTEQCDDSNMADNDACTSACQDAACGDGIIYAGHEDCDDGNMDDTDDCVGMCTYAVCGDGFVRAGIEECDDTNADPGDGCTEMCMVEYRLVFATSTTFDGNIGGLADADMICQTRAEAANLSGTYMAWLSTDQGSPSTRFVQSAVPYQMVQGTKVADNWADLTDGTIDNAISRTESGAASVNSIASCGSGDRTVHTGTGTDGTALPDTCNNWTSNSNADMGTIGRTTSANMTWSDWCAVTCDQAAAIYCFQQ